MKKRVLALVVSAAVFVTMSFGMTCTAFAGENISMTVLDEVDQTALDVMGLGNTEEIMEEKAAAQQAADQEALKGTSIASDEIPLVPLNEGVYLYGSTQKFQVKVPSNGYLTLTLAGLSGNEGDEYIYTVKAKTKGFSDYVYFSSSQNIRWIGVKKGTYTFSIDTSANYVYVKAKFTKVKEKYGKKKSKARTLKKKKAQKGLMITAGQKAHWYKFKNPKNQKVKIILNTKTTITGEYLGGLKVTVYNGKQKLNNIIYDGKRKSSIQLYTLGMGNKLKKGTYYIKVAPYKKGTGFFTIKW